MRFTLPLVTLLTLAYAEFAASANSYRIDPAQSLLISEHGTSRIVKNNGSSSVMVPTKTSTEWTTFISNKPAYISLTSCPSGYVGVPEDAANGTSAFCIMVYEAKNVAGVPTSQAASAPWVNVNQATARSACQGLGTGYDLPSNSQWQALAQNVEMVASNWSSGTVGTGCLRQGNLGTAFSGCSYDGANPEYGTGRNTLASMTLSTGDVLWDINGNVHERIIPMTDPTGTAGVITITANVATGTPKTLWGPKGNYSSGCSGDSSGSCGFGYLQYRSAPNNVAFRSGAYDNQWGIFGMHGGYGDLTDPTIGFRCVYNP